MNKIFKKINKFRRTDDKSLWEEARNCVIGI